MVEDENTKFHKTNHKLEEKKKYPKEENIWKECFIFMQL